MAYKTAGTTTESVNSGIGILTSRLALTLAAALLVCTDPACAAANDPAEPTDSGDYTAPADPSVPNGPDGSQGPADPVDPTDPGATEGTPDPAGTSDPGDSPTTDASSTGAAEPPGTCAFFKPSFAVDCAEISRIAPTGVGISEAHVVRRYFRLEDASGAALGSEYHECLLVTDSDCQAVPVALEAVPSRSITALLVRPLADAKANAELAKALSNFIDGRPEGEPIGVFRWGAAVTQISTPTTDRNRLHHLITSGLQPLEGDGLPIADAIAAIAEPLVSIAHDSHHGLRQLLVVAPGHAAQDPKALALGGDGASVRVELLADVAIEAALQSANARLDATLAAGGLLLRQCGLEQLPGLHIHTAGGGPTLALPDIAIAGADQLEGQASCDPADQGPTPALPGIVELTFSPTEQTDYEARVDDLSKEAFYGSVRTNLNAPGMHARVKLKLHGQGSLSCERKSISINYTDDLPRQWLSDSGTDRFLLVSMCKDDRYVTQFTANQLMAQLGLLAPKFRMVELVIGGKSQGVYLVLEKAQAVLEHDTIRPRVIVRRRSDIEGAKPELDYAVDDEVQALADYETLLSQAEVLKGDPLLAWLDKSMDLDQYLRWISLMSLLESGDFIDEVYFMSNEATGPNASPVDYFTISTWDQDDIFSSCHGNGINAIVDPHGLLNCVEGRLDHAIFAEPKVYKRFAKMLETTLAWLDEATFDAAMKASEDAVLAVLVRDEARAAMVELLDDNPKAVAYEVAEAEVLARGAALRKRFAKRRALLIQLLAAYKP